MDTTNIPIPAAELFAPPERLRDTLSPDGTRIAFLGPWKDRLNVWVQDVLDTGDDAGLGEPRCVTADEHRSVLGYSWTDDPRFLLYLQDDGGDENFHLFRVDLTDADAPAVDLTPFPGVRVLGVEQATAHPGAVLIHLNRRDPAAFDLHAVDVATGELTVLVENPGDVVAWLTARDGTVYAVGRNDGGDIALRRVDPAAEWPVVAVLDGTDRPLGPFPLQLTPDATGLWTGTHGATDRLRLVRLDLATGEETEVAGHPRYDVDVRSQALPVPPPLITDRATDDLLAVRYYGERQVIVPVDARFAEVVARIQELSDGELGAVSSDEGGRRWIASFYGDRDPGSTWLYDHATGDARRLHRRLPDRDRATFAPSTPVTITARDGLALPSYVTLPVGVEPRGLPTVLVVHGGPWARDWWTFDPTVQFLASRGYAVLQVNFRGSTGFGRAHTAAAIGEFAGAMHDDLVDAVEWAVAQGYTDPARVAIFGGSYGGYAALVGVTFTPDLFAAAVDYVGISNLVTFLRALPPFTRPAIRGNWYRYAGDPDVPEQEADLLARSPITRVEKITTPLLVIQGANDTRVVRAESDSIVGSLRDRGVDVEYLVFDDEGHIFVNTENLVAMHEAAGRFLAGHLGGRT